MLIPLTGANVAQFTVNGIVTGSMYALVAVGFGMIIHIAHRFHFAYGAIYALTAFLAAQLQTSFGWTFIAGLIVATLCGVVIAVAAEMVVYAPLAARVGHQERALFPVFVASLGISTSIEAVINLVWPNPVTTEIGVSPVQIGPVNVTSLSVAAVIVTWVLVLLVAGVIRWTPLGRMIRAVRVNAPLSIDYGIRPGTMYAIVFAIGTTLGGVGAVFLAAQSAPQSDMGDNLVLYAITAAFIAGAARSPSIIALLALAMGIIQSWSLFVVSSTWSQLVIFAILLIFIAVKAARAVNWRRLAGGRRPQRGRPLPSVTQVPEQHEPDAGAVASKLRSLES